MSKASVSLKSANVQTLKKKRSAVEQVDRRKQKFDNKKQHILDTALSVFSKYGYYGTTVEQIATAADISKTNLFYYFQNKEKLYLTILENILNDWLAPIGGFDENDDPKLVLENYIRLKLELSRDQPEASRLFCLEIIQGAPIIHHYLSNDLKKLIGEKSQVIRKWIRQGKLKDVEPVQLIFIIWSTTQHYADFHVQIKALTGKSIHNKSFFEETCRTIQRVILDSLTP